MTAPNHLWSGDWQRESAAAAEKARRRRPTDAPAEPPSAEAPTSRPFREAFARLVASMRGARLPRVQAHVLVAIATLLSAVVAYVIVSALLSPSSQGLAQHPPPSQQASAASAGPVWLGVDTTAFPLIGGAMIMAVAPGSPADSAGLEPGDVISEIDNRPVQTPADLDSALAGMRVGQQVQIGYRRGPISLTTQATLAARQHGP